ncbi:MAG TPA: ATP-dependent DNA helicase [Burkholderiaceae bacterium]|nr:ATP-dependent DNA helicase [Burkholderiaceae bacterium]
MKLDSPDSSNATVAVRELCEFAAKTGDLDLRFTPAPTAEQGQAGHHWLGSQETPPYETELTLQATWQHLTVRGRADGYHPTLNRVDEYKSHRGDLARQPANHRALHWAQAKVYGWLLCQSRGLDRIDVCLVYLNVATRQTTRFTDTCQASELVAWVDHLCGRYAAWAGQQAQHRAARDAALNALAFPQPAFRAGQRELAKAVYRAAVNGQCLTAQAPTGIGKTLGTLFPLLKAMPGQQIDKVFYLTAKTPGRQLALDTLQALPTHTPLRVLELVARDKACEHPDKACHGDDCPLARGFYDRLPGARLAAVSMQVQDRSSVRAVASAHQVCPYYLTQELAKWADVVVGDYNHFFDLHAMLHALTHTNGWRVALLVDEAHNLIDRGRAMATASLTLANLRAVQRHAAPPLARVLKRLQRTWLAWQRGLPQQPDASGSSPRSGLPASRLRNGGESAPAWLNEPPADLVAAVQHCVTELGALSTDDPLTLTGPALQWLFDMTHWLEVAQRCDDHFLVSVTRHTPAPGARQRTPDTRITLHNVVPAALLAERWAAAHASILFSATLTPPAFYRTLLGLPADTPHVEVASPFGPEQLQVRVARHISTRFDARQASVEPIVDILTQQMAARPGNYLAFFSSFDYLEQVANAYRAQHPDQPMWHQTRQMDEPARNAFLQRFEAQGRGIGFAVLGGAFGEGIDLPGSRLIGAFVVTLGMPQVNPVNEAFSERLNQLLPGQGHDYTYLYPGLQKVVQAAGRVIRTTDDTGTVWLLDQRYTRPQVRRLLPNWWHLSN